MPWHTPASRSRLRIGQQPGPHPPTCPTVRPTPGRRTWRSLPAAWFTWCGKKRAASITPSARATHGRRRLRSSSATAPPWSPAAVTVCTWPTSPSRARRSTSSTRAGTAPSGPCPSMSRARRLSPRRPSSYAHQAAPSTPSGSRTQAVRRLSITVSPVTETPGRSFPCPVAAAARRPQPAPAATSFTWPGRAPTLSQI
ncbi:MAG: hypothetical protein MAG451_02292 [Anaerolineales bacterium]|nr:hypothetical protein [Anaerolineales bacterium]